MQVLTNTTKQWIKTPIILWTIISLLFVMTGIYVVFNANTARAGALTAVKDTISDSAPEITTIPTHTFVFTTATQFATDSATGLSDMEIWLYFPQIATYEFDINALTTADFTATCTSCSSATFTILTVNLTDGGGMAGDDTIEIDLDESGLTDGTPIPVGSVFTVVIDAAPGIGNPTKNATAGTADTYQINIGAREESAGSDADTGTAMVAIIEGVTVSATISETLSFAINNVGVGAGNCETADDANVDTFVDIVAAADNTVPFGNLGSSNNFYAACQDLTISTNASGGYTITAQSDTSLQNASSDNISSGNCDGACTQSSGAVWTSNANNGFAYFCNDETGTDCDTGGNTSSLYRNFACTGADADCDLRTGGETAIAIMGNTGSTNANVGRIYYKLSVPGTQPAGTYSSTITYVATPTF